MGTKSKNKTLIYVIAIAVIVLAFFLLGGGEWMNGMSHGRSLHMNNLNWTQIIISLLIGFVLGLFVAKRKW